MGSSSSKRLDDEERIRGIMAANVEKEMAKLAMRQREMEMALTVARARDTIHIFGSAWAGLVIGTGTVFLAGHKPPTVLAVPIVLGALALGNLVDMAYGNKLARITKEAEYLLDNERGRFIPMKQSPYAQFYTYDDRKQMYLIATAVGDLFPTKLWARMARRDTEKR